jgi:ADP-heptose:LPS heptosyltransferase
MMGRLLVVHSGGVGDFICTFPALSMLAQTHAIEVAGLPERVTLARAAGIAERVHDLDRTGFTSVFSGPDARLREIAAGFDDALVWMADEDGMIASGLRKAGIPRVRCFPGIPPRGWNGHAAQWYGSCAGVPLSLPYQAPFPRAAVAPEVVIHPGSGGRDKNWPMAHFEELAARLVARGLQVSWCLGPAEDPLSVERATLSPMNLVELAGLLGSAKLYVGNDSGISHLAGAAGCRTVAIFGPTDPVVWQPAGPHVRVARGEPWPSAATVFDVAMALMAHPRD